MLLPLGLRSRILTVGCRALRFRNDRLKLHSDRLKLHSRFALLFDSLLGRSWGGPIWARRLVAQLRHVDCRMRASGQWGPLHRAADDVPPHGELSIAPHACGALADALVSRQIVESSSAPCPRAKRAGWRLTSSHRRLMTPDDP